MGEEAAGPGFTELQQALLGSHSIEQFLQSWPSWLPGW